MKTFHKNKKGYIGNTLNLSINKISLGFLLVALNFGCKKFVQIPPPQTQLVSANVFNNNSTATSALTNIYTLMFTNIESFTMAQSMGLYSDELKNYSADQGENQLYTNSLTALAGAGEYPNWSLYYKYIYDANAVIEGLKNTVGCSPAVKQQLTGEAFFVRAFWQFYLTNIYGDVPLVLTTNYTINGTIARSPRVQVLQQVVTDLQNAQNLLSTNYVDGSDTVATTAKVRPNKATATALLARAYLYLGDYSKTTSYYVKADSAATAVIASNIYSLSPLSGVFLVNSKEAIWQLQTPSTANWDTSDGGFFILVSAPGTSGSNNTATISTQLMSSFELNDQRQISWIGSYTTTTTPKVTYYFPYKYKNNTLLNTEYSTVLRLGEQYLIRAEAEAQEGKISNTVSDLNMIRTRAGLPNYSGAIDKASLLAAILHERQVELFTEWGARWFDLQRTGNAATVLGSPGNICQAKGGIWNIDNHQLLFPIPQSDRTSDPNLTQNVGY